MVESERLGLNLRKRLALLPVAALIVLIVLLYASIGCRVSEEQIKASPLNPFVVPVLEGYAIGFSFNLTNLGSCELVAESIHVDLRTAIYPDGRVDTMNAAYSESWLKELGPGQTQRFSYSFDSYFQFRPAKLNLRIEISFGESGHVIVFDGELAIPQK